MKIVTIVTGLVAMLSVAAAATPTASQSSSSLPHHLFMPG
jgi:hypothetical protein